VKTTELLRFNGSVERDSAIHAWMKEPADELGAVAQQLQHTSDNRGREQ
jgi:hypothetical protein